MLCQPSQFEKERGYSILTMPNMWDCGGNGGACVVVLCFCQRCMARLPNENTEEYKQ
jgi:hypothetical protein